MYSMFKRIAYLFKVFARLFYRIFETFNSLFKTIKYAVWTLMSVWAGPIGGLVRAFCFGCHTLIELEGKIKIADDWIRTGNPTAQQTYWFWVIFFFSFPNFNLLFCSLVLHKPLMIFSRRRWTNWIGPTVKHVWKAATHVLHNFWGFVENATAYHLDQYSHNRHLIKSSMDKLFPLLRIEHRDD